MPLQASPDAIRRLRLPVLVRPLLWTAALATAPASALTYYGDLNNFDCVNDTGGETHGFEIEITGVRSTDVTYTYDYNHYGTPTIREDRSNPAAPRVFVRYAARPVGSGWSAYTAAPTAPISPTDGHACTDVSVNQGCEHFGVGVIGTPSAVKYHWLIADPQQPGQLTYDTRGAAIAAPKWRYTPPVLRDPALPPAPGNIAKPAEVLAAIPPPQRPVQAARQFGDPSWMKVVKTTTHRADVVALDDLMSRDRDGDGRLDWTNGEPPEVETEWKLVQHNAAGDDDIQALAADPAGDGREVVTRRYEFYAYEDPNPSGAGSIDGENGEAMCSEVAADGVHGVGSVSVTNAAGNSYDFDCGALAVVGRYLGAQMAAFAAVAPLGTIDHAPDAVLGVELVPRALVIGGNTPYRITAVGTPPGLRIGDYTDPLTGDVRHGVLSGTPQQAGSHDLQLSVTDADGNSTQRTYRLQVRAEGQAPPLLLTVNRSGTGTGSVTGGGIDCGNTCSAEVVAGSAIRLTATASAGSSFDQWSGACTGRGDCVIDPVAADSFVTASFSLPPGTRHLLTVTRTGPGRVTSRPFGISCGNRCSARYRTGTRVTLTAKPGFRKRFLGWGGACSGTARTCTVAVSRAESVSAAFAP